MSYEELLFLSLSDSSWLKCWTHYPITQQHTLYVNEQFYILGNLLTRSNKPAENSAKEHFKLRRKWFMKKTTTTTKDTTCRPWFLRNWKVNLSLLYVQYTIVYVVIVLIYHCCKQMQNWTSLLHIVTSNRGMDPKIPFRQFWAARSLHLGTIFRLRL